MRKEFITIVCKSILFSVLFAFGHTDSLAQLKDCKTGYNYFLLADTCDIYKYINCYREKFCKGQDKRYTQSIYLDTTYFNFIADYFADHPDTSYDGIRIYFASYNIFLDTLYTHQADEKQITLLMVPTINRTAQFDEFNNQAKKKPRFFDAVNHGELCPNSCNDDTGPFTDSQQSGNATRPHSPLIFLEPAKAKEYIRNYRRNYRFLWNQKHTKSLWLSRANFLFLKGFFDSENKNAIKYGGVRIFFASYNKKIDETQNRRKKQITLIFTAALNNKPHNPVFKALRDFDKLHHSEYFGKKCVYGELSPKAKIRRSF